MKSFAYVRAISCLRPCNQLPTSCNHLPTRRPKGTQGGRQGDPASRRTRSEEVDNGGTQGGASGRAIPGGDPGGSGFSSPSGGANGAVVDNEQGGVRGVFGDVGARGDGPRLCGEEQVHRQPASLHWAAAAHVAIVGSFPPTTAPRNAVGTGAFTTW